MNSSLFGKSVSSKIKYDKEEQTNPKQEIAIETEISPLDDILGSRSHVQSQMKDWTTNSNTDSENDNILNERDQNS